MKTIHTRVGKTKCEILVVTFGKAHPIFAIGMLYANVDNPIEKSPDVRFVIEETLAAARDQIPMGVGLRVTRKK